MYKNTQTATNQTLIYSYFGQTNLNVSSTKRVFYWLFILSFTKHLILGKIENSQTLF